MMRARTVVLSAALLISCADGRPAPESEATTQVLENRTSDPAATQMPADSTSPISTRMVIYIQASDAELAALQTEGSEEETSVVGDDFMWYRAQAFEHIEQNGWPLRTLTGKRPLTFVVDGKPRRYDLAGVTTLDAVVLYETNREPRIVAPIDIGEADAYFQ